MKPLFDGEYIAFSSFDRIALRELIRKIDKPFRNIGEVGSWLGNGSTSTIIEEIRDGSGILYCIDHWQGNANVKKHQELVLEYNIFGTFLNNVSLARGSKVVKPLVMSSRDAGTIIRDGFFDLVFIDADHSYEETTSDISIWLPKVADGGTLCGHDCEARADSFDPDYLWKNRHNDTVYGNDIFPRVHPGVILAVYEKIGSTTVHYWADDIINLENGIQGRSTIWDITVHYNTREKLSKLVRKVFSK